MVFTYNPFTISPDYCGSSVFCNNVLGPLGVAVECKELDINDQLILSFDGDDYLNSGFAPGQYIYTYDVIGDGIPNEKESFTVTFELIDPCDPPDELNPPQLENQEYTITDQALIYEHPDMLIRSPSFCPVEIDYLIPALTNNVQPVTRFDNQFRVYYDQDLSPVGQTQSISVQVTAKSNFLTSQSKILVVVRTFTITYNNPCLDQDFVTIIPPDEIPEETYIVFDDLKTFNHDQCQIKTEPIIHSLCGDIQYNAQYIETGASI